MLEHSALLAFSFLGTILILVPLLFHVRNKNVAIISLCLWLSLFNGIVFINGIVWNGVPQESSPAGKGYCDIATRLQRVTQTALIGCAIAILRYLATILSSKGSPAMTTANKVRQNLIDIAIIYTAPIFMTVIQLILFREPRYAIIQFYGCTSVIDETAWESLLVTIWAPALGVYAIFYALAVIYALNKKRTELRSMLRDSSLNVNRFTRLFIIAMIAIFVVTPVNLYNFSTQVKDIDVHSIFKPRGDFSLILADFDQEVTGEGNFWQYWFSAMISLVFAALFGVGKEAFSTYKRWAYTIPGAPSVFEFAMSSTTKLTSRLSAGFSSTFSHGSSIFTSSRMTTGSRTSDVFSDKHESMSSDVVEKDSSVEEIGLKQSKANINKKKWAATDSLMQGHNQTLRGTSTSRVWSSKEEGDLLPSPDKIKMQHMVTQQSTRNSTLSMLSKEEGEETSP